MSKITKLANYFRTKISATEQVPYPSIIESAIKNLFDEIDIQLEPNPYHSLEDIYESPTDVVKLKKHFNFLMETSMGANRDNEYGYLLSLGRETFKTVKKYEQLFYTPQKIYSLLGVSSGPASEITGGLMEAARAAHHEQRVSILQLDPLNTLVNLVKFM